MTDRLLVTSPPSVETPMVFKEPTEVPPVEQTVREEGETWTNEEGKSMKGLNRRKIFGVFC